MSALSFALFAEFSMSGFFSETILPWWERFAQVFVGEDLVIQLSVIVGAWFLAFVLSAIAKPLCRRITEAIEERDDWVESLIDWLSDNFFRILLASLLWSASFYFDGQNRDLALLGNEAAVSLVAAEPGVNGSQVTPSVFEAEKNYILLRAAASVATLILISGALPKAIRSKAYYKTLFFVVAVVLLLNLLGLWEVIRDGLDSLQVLPVTDGGATRVTALTIGKGIFVILILIPMTTWVMRLGEGRVKNYPALTPALQMLVIKVLKAFVVVGAILFGISSMGVDLSALAFLGGGIGLGLGFGFQKVISNLISGVILLSDHSIKPGDVIEVDNTYGWINKLSARYVSVITRDGMEHLIPNETLITEKVTNWSFSDDLVRVRVPFGVSYDADGRKVMELANRAAVECDRVVQEKTPTCWLLGFGDSSVDFELRIWIRDPANGLGSIRSEIYMRMWELFKEHDIEIPFPQRDINLRGGAPIEVVMKKSEE